MDEYNHSKLKEYQNRYKNPKLDASSSKAMETWNSISTLPLPAQLVLKPLYFAFDFVRILFRMIF